MFHLNEHLYTEEETDLRASGVKQFDYVNPANRDVQIEMEQAVTAHLEAIGARIDTCDYTCPDFGEQDFPVEASVIIPVRNRVKTILDAVNSALAQKTTFRYNVIVVDNHSTDGTTEAIKKLIRRLLYRSMPLVSLPSFTLFLPAQTLVSADVGMLPLTINAADVLPYNSTATTCIARTTPYNRSWMLSMLSRLQWWLVPTACAILI